MSRLLHALQLLDQRRDARAEAAVAQSPVMCVERAAARAPSPIPAAASSEPQPELALAPPPADELPSVGWVAPVSHPAAETVATVYSEAADGDLLSLITDESAEFGFDDLPASGRRQPPDECAEPVEGFQEADAPRAPIREKPLETAPARDQRRFSPLEVSDAIRQVRDRILDQLREREVRVIALARAGRAGEDSAVAVELAQAFVGFSPGEVLVVDAGSHGAGWDVKLGCGHGAGTEEALLGLESLPSVARPTTWPGLRAIPAGSRRHDVQFARSDDIERFLSQCRAHYGTVVIDLGHVDATHVVPVARRCDAAYLVVRLGETERARARAALDQLQDAGVQTLGCILASAPRVVA